MTESESLLEEIFNKFGEALGRQGIIVIKPIDAVDIVKSAIKERDEIARQWASLNNEKVPEWVGND